MNTNKSLRIGLLGLTSAVAGFALQGCFAQQPLPECSVTISAAGQGLPPYFVLLTKVDSTGPGTCGDLKTMQVGMQRFRTKANGGDFTVAIRSSPVVDPYLGYNYSENIDDSNDCVNESDCQGADDILDTCVNFVDDGGIELNDGTPVIAIDDKVGNIDALDGGFVDGAEDGGFIELDLANECGPVPEAIERRDPTDPDGKKLSVIGKMPQFPTAGLCAVTDFTDGTENFQAETLTLVDGSTKVLDAVTYSVAWSNFKVINTAKVPSTGFIGDLKFTEGGCTANYKARGFWSGSTNGNAAIKCTPTTDEQLSYATECDPSGDLDAGRVLGSGINPDFAPKCDKTLKVCVPSVELETLK